MCSQSPTEHMQMRPVCMQMRCLYADEQRGHSLLRVTIEPTPTAFPQAPSCRAAWEEARPREGGATCNRRLDFSENLPIESGQS